MSETIGTARLDVVVDTASLEVGIERAKRSVSGMSTQAQAEYNKLNAAEKRRVDSLKRQADMLGLTREQQLAYNITMRTSGTVQQELLSRIQQTNQGLAQGAKQLNQYGLTAGQTANAMRQRERGLHTGSARWRAIRAQELVERTAAGSMGWLDLTDRLAALRAVYQRAPRREGAR